MAGTSHLRIWKKKIVILTIICGLVFNLVGCGLLGNREQNNPPKDGQTNLPKIGLVTGEGGIDDPYYKLAWEGLQKAEQEQKVQVAYVKAKNDKDYVSKLGELSKDKYSVIFTLGTNAVPAVIEAASKNTKIKYICLDTKLEDTIPPNVLGINYKVEEASFLAGYLSGKMTESNVAGFISGDNKEAAQKYYYGYKAGLRLANSRCELMKGLAGTYTNKTRIEQITQRMIEAKADVIFHVAGPAGKSMIKMMDKRGKYAIGSDVDQNDLAPEAVLTSVIKNNDQVVLEIIKKFQDDSLQLGKNQAYGLAENGVGLAPTTKDMIPENVYKQILENQEQISQGKMIVPATEEASLTYKK